MNEGQKRKGIAEWLMNHVPQMKDLLGDKNRIRLESDASSRAVAMARSSAACFVRMNPPSVSRISPKLIARRRSRAIRNGRDKSSTSISSPGIFLYDRLEYTAQNIPTGKTGDAARDTWLKNNATVILVNANTGALLP